MFFLYFTTSNIQFSHYVISLIAGCTTVDCLVDEKLAPQPVTTIGMFILKEKKKSYITTNTWTNMTSFLYRVSVNKYDGSQ